MKRFSLVLLLLFFGLQCFAAEQSDQYCYIFNEDHRIQEKDAPVLHSVKKNDWFLSDKLYNPEKDAYATIDGKSFKAQLTYHLMTEEEYDKILSGKKVVNDQDKLTKWFKSNIPANKLLWEKEKARIAKREAEIAKYSQMIPFKVMNNWTMLLLLLPFMIPVVLLFIIAMKYGDQAESEGEPSVARPWLAVLLVLVEAALGYYYGRFLFLAFQGLESEVHLSYVLFIIIAAIVVITLLYSTVKIKKEMLAFYQVKFGAGKIITAILVAAASYLTAMLILLLVDQLVHLPEGFVDDTLVNTIVAVISLPAPIIYIKKTLLKQNREAHGLVVPLLVFAVFGAAVLALGGILYFAFKMVMAKDSTKVDIGKNDDELPEPACSNCYYYGAWACNEHKLYGVCEGYIRRRD